MAFTVPTAEPDAITAGDSAEWTKSFSQYSPVDGWTLIYKIVKQDGSNYATFSATTSGTSFAVNVAPSITSTWPSGVYQIQGVVTLGAEAHTVWSAQLTVNPGIQPGGTDTRSNAKRILDSLEAVFEGRATSDILDSMVEGTSFRRMNPEQLMKLRDYYMSVYRSEQAAAKIANNQQTGRNIYAKVGIIGPSPGYPYTLGIGGQRV